MTLTGSHWIAGLESAESPDTFNASNPATGEDLEPAFHEATAAEIDAAVDAATAAFEPFRKKFPDARADFLEAIAEELLALGDDFLERVSAETGYPLERCAGEKMRAVGHNRMFAGLIREGSWVDARIDRADPTRQPLPKPDVRSMMMPMGPVAVFGASNFPIAISVLGTDTVSAFAAGCPVVVKGHPAHPGACEFAAGAIHRAAERTRMPEGVFSLLHGRGHEVGTRLVEHPGIFAAAFTGSLAGGRALYDAACRRPVPIPFYAEMGSVNPVFVLPGALEERAEAIADGFVAALVQGVGQFCTNPGLVLGYETDDWRRFSDLVAERVAATRPATMLHAGIHSAFLAGLEERGKSESLQLLGKTSADADPARLEAAPHIFWTTQQGLMDDPTLFDELFGPVSIFAGCGVPEDFAAVVEKLDGSLSATIHGTEADLAEHRDLVEALQRKAGRLIFNGFPVGLEVCHSIHHGGPYPATSLSRYTSVGTRAIERFVRPVCYQDWPDGQLPMELQDKNPRGVMRLVDGTRTREGI